MHVAARSSLKTAVPRHQLTAWRPGYTADLRRLVVARGKSRHGGGGGGWRLVGGWLDAFGWP